LELLDQQERDLDVEEANLSPEEQRVTDMIRAMEADGPPKLKMDSKPTPDEVSWLRIQGLSHPRLRRRRAVLEVLSVGRHPRVHRGARRIPRMRRGCGGRRRPGGARGLGRTRHRANLTHPSLPVNIPAGAQTITYM
jgi:hypothetical protein